MYIYSIKIYITFLINDIRPGISWDILTPERVIEKETKMNEGTENLDPMSQCHELGLTRISSGKTSSRSSRNAGYYSKD